MNRQDLFARLRGLKADQRFTPQDVALIDTLADDLGMARMNDSKRTSSAGLQLIKDVEGLRLRAYQDTGGVWTIGVGHTGLDVVKGKIITEAEADRLLAADVREAEEIVARLFPVTTQPQFDALVSFTFNLGEPQVSSSTLRKLHNAGDYAGAAAQFARWKFDNGKEVAGLVTRRRKEAAMYGRPA